MKQWSYVNSAAQILSIYKGQEPFASFLKKYFREHKKFGSKDRKQISHLCYCYFRLGQSALPFSVEERILVGLFFCSHEFNEVLETLKPEWNREVSLSLREKCSMLNVQWSMLNVFPWKDELSKGIEHEKFTASFFIQPDLFLRLRPGKESVVQQKLKNAGIEFRLLKEDSVALTNAAKLDEVIEMNKEAVVQDFSSQSVVRSLTSSPDGEHIEPPVRRQHQTKLAVRRGRQTAKVWDCCAASGGKSIMVYDLDPTIELTVSDVRESILINLRKRFEEAGIRKYRSFIADLSAPGFKQSTHFDLVICDAPCTGSGTWSRTPEQLYYFDENKIDKYASLQKRIVTNIIPSIREGGYLLYITCSVFKKENEEVVQFIQDNFAFELIEANTIKGYEIKADTMFAALFKKRKQPGDDLV